MNLFIILKVALRSLRRMLLRSSLTAIGIIIGVAAVIALVGIGNGAKARIEANYARFDMNRVYIRANMPHRPWTPFQPVPRGEGLTIDDYFALRERMRGVAMTGIDVTPQAGPASANGVGSAVSVWGLDVRGLELMSDKVASGAYFGQTDLDSAAAICLISTHLSEIFFGARAAVGGMIRLGTVPFTVVGVLAADDAVSSSNDVTVYVPYTSALRRLDRSAPLTITLKPKSATVLEELRREALDLLESRRGQRKVEFTTDNFQQILQAARESTRVMTRLLTAIAGISLFVGGVGITNIMLVSVAERTREIGIRLAIGTRCADILRQFLIEAVILSVLGGAIGILLGLGASYVCSHVYGMPTDVTMGSVLGAFLCSAGIGVLFGYYPARRAALLDPIEALRAE